MKKKRSKNRWNKFFQDYILSDLFSKSFVSKRLRKKYRVGEYTQHGFNFCVYFDNNFANNMPEYYYFDQLITLIESKGWYCGGGGDIKKQKYSFFVAPLKGTITQNCQDNFIDDLYKISNIVHIICMHLTDVWNNKNVDNYYSIADEKEKEYEKTKNN